MSKTLKICPVTVAKQRLAEKKNEVRKHLEQTGEFIDSVKMKNALLTSSYKKCFEHINNQFEILHNALNIKQKELCRQLEYRQHRVLEANTKLVRDGHSLVDKISMVLQDADRACRNIEGDVEVIKKCSLITQALEETFLSLLLLLSGTESEDTNPQETAQETEVTLQGVLDSIGRIQFTAERDQLTSEEPDSCLQSKEENVVYSSTDETDECIEAKEGFDCNDPNSCHRPPAIKTDGSHCPVSVMLKKQQQLDVVVSCVASPVDMHVQQCGDEIVELSSRMREFYRDSTMTANILTDPQIGDLCCAQFTVDDCWYRARILSVEQISTTQANSVVPVSSVWVKVQYVDYGNQEQLPLSRLQPLDPSFCSLPCQAIPCFLSGMEPATELSSDNLHVRKGWTSQVNKCLEKLLLGNKVHINIVEGYSDRYGVDVLVPSEWLVSDESFATLPMSTHSVEQMPQIAKQEPLINLYAFLCHIAVAKPTVPASNVVAHSTQPPPSAEVREEGVLQNKLSQAGMEENSDTFNVSHEGSPDCPPPTIQKLRPLIIKLGLKSDFSALISHAVSPREFYVNSVQEAQVFLQIEELSKHYSVSSNQHCLALSSVASNLKGGAEPILCCVRSPDDGLWYRGVITTASQLDNSFSVQLLDYGECIVVQPESVFELADHFCTYPAQAIRCSLTGVQSVPVDSEGSEYTFEESTCSSHVEKMICKALQKCNTQEKLVACCVKDEGVDQELTVKYGCQVSVDIKDTSGQDIKRLALQECSDMGSELPGTRLSEWNPMERDYLAHRNNYSIDDEDAELALHGYKSTNRLCRFYQSKDGCFRGDVCPFLHLQKGVTDQQLKEAFMSIKELEPPHLNAVVMVIVTAIISPTRFFVQMPLGSKSMLLKAHNQQDEQMARTFMEMLQDMRDYYNQHVFSERNTLYPGVGEMVVVRYAADNQWYRARVVDTVNAEKIKVFYVDYGHYDVVCFENIRSIKKEFLNVSIQAVECYLNGLLFEETASPSDKVKAKEYFQRLVCGKVLVAKVVTRHMHVLGVELYSEAVHVNKQLVSQPYHLRETEASISGKNVSVIRTSENLTPA